MKLICFPHAGGFSFYYNFLKELENIEKKDILLFEYSGRGTKIKEPREKGIIEISKKAALEIASWVAKDEYIIFGHSMGAFVAYETEAILEKSYCMKAQCLIISGQYPPIYFNSEHYFFKSRTQLNKYLLKLTKFPKEIKENRQIYEILFKQCRDDILMLQHYSPTLTKLKAKAVVICGDNDIEINETEKLILWSENFEKLIEVKIFSGSHFYMKEKKDDFLTYLNKIIRGVKENEYNN